VEWALEGIIYFELSVRRRLHFHMKTATSEQWKSNWVHSASISTPPSWVGLIKCRELLLRLSTQVVLRCAQVTSCGRADLCGSDPHQWRIRVSTCASRRTAPAPPWHKSAYKFKVSQSVQGQTNVKVVEWSSVTFRSLAACQLSSDYYYDLRLRARGGEWLA